MDSRTGQESFAVSSAPGHKPHVTSIFDFSAEALGQLRLWIEQNPPAIGIKNIIGFSQFTVQVATSIATSQTTTSSTLVDLATVGPTLSGLPPGQYVVLWGCDSSTSSTATQASMVITNAGSSIASGATNQATTTASVMKFAIVTFSAVTTLVAKYQSTDNVSTATFANRSLAALKYANP